jgi:hypothetical protein
VLTQARLKELLEYDPITGAFTWRVSLNPRAMAGYIAGSIDSDGYLRTRVDRRHYKLHRLAFLYVEGGFPKEEVDHINGDRRDNSWANLRKANSVENRRNAKRYRKNKSEYRGVYPHHSGRWRAMASVNSRCIHLGIFDTREEASAVFEIFTLKVHGDFHRTKGVELNGD